VRCTYPSSGHSGSSFSCGRFLWPATSRSCPPHGVRLSSRIAVRGRTGSTSTAVLGTVPHPHMPEHRVLRLRTGVCRGTVSAGDGTPPAETAGVVVWSPVSTHPRSAKRTVLYRIAGAIFRARNELLPPPSSPIRVPKSVL